MLKNVQITYVFIKKKIKNCNYEFKNKEIKNNWVIFAYFYIYYLLIKAMQKTLNFFTYLLL